MFDAYINLITETRKLLKDILDDRDHGALTFVGINGFENLTVKGPGDLELLRTGTVVAVGCIEWMRASGDKWVACYEDYEHLSSDDMYVRCLTAGQLRLCHRGL
mgnify:FL=1